MIPSVSAVASVLSGAASATDALTSSSTTTQTGSPGVAAADFGQMLAQISSGAVNSLQTAEATSIQGLQGKASVQKVVEAVMSAQETLQTALAVRDKVVSAYQEVTRMSI